MLLADDDTMTDADNAGSGPDAAVHEISRTFCPSFRYFWPGRFDLMNKEGGAFGRGRKAC